MHATGKSYLLAANHSTSDPNARWLVIEVDESKSRDNGGGVVRYGAVVFSGGLEAATADIAARCGGPPPDVLPFATPNGAFAS